MLLAQLGTFRYRAGSVQPTAEPTALPQAQANPQTEEFALVRARFEHMTRAEYRAAGYTLTTVACNSPPYWFTPNAASPALIADSAAGKPMDPQHPVALLLTGNLQRVVGLLWDMEETTEKRLTAAGALRPTRAAPLWRLSRYPLLSAHHLFKPNGYVLFARYDPDYKCSAPRRAAQEGR